MSKSLDVTIVCFDDWQGLYIGGELVWEGHGLDGDDALYILDRHGLLPGVKLDSFYPNDNALLWQFGDRMPKDLSELLPVLEVDGE